MDHLGRVLRGASLHRKGPTGAQQDLRLLELGDVLLTDPDVLQRLKPVAGDLLRRPQEPRQVLRGVLARLGRVVAHTAEDLDPDPTLELGIGRDALSQDGVEVLALVSQLEHPRLVVDPCRAVVRLLQGHAHELGQVVRRPVDAVAQTDGLDVGSNDRGPPHVHRHRVGVVQQPCVGADLTHVGGQLGEHREGAQRAEHATDARRVADGLLQTVGRGDPQVRDGRGDPTDLDHVDHEVSTGQRLAAVQRRTHPRTGAELLVQAPRGALGDGEPLGIDVMQGELDIRELGELEEVGAQLTGEDHTACTDERDSDHAGDTARSAHSAQRDSQNR